MKHAAVFCFLIGASSGSILAEGALQPVVLPAEPRLIGLLETNPIDVAARFTVELPGLEEKASKKLQIEIKHVDPEIANISFVPALAEVKAGKKTQVLVTVEGVEWPGVYKADLRMTPQEEGSATEPLDFKMIVDTRTKPRVIALQNELKLNLVNCWWLGCWLAEAVVPEVTRFDRLALEVRNDSLKAVLIEPKARIRRNAVQGTLPYFNLLPKSAQLEIGRSDTFELGIARSELPPGRYEGNIAFIARPSLESDLLDKEGGRAVVRNRSETLVAAAVNVRGGIFWPIVLIVSGIIAGRLNRQISTPEAQARLRIVDRIYVLGPKIDTLQNLEAKRFCMHRIDEIRLDLNDRNVANEQINGAVLQLERQVRLFTALDRLEGKTSDQAILGLIGEARSLVRASDFDKAEQKRQEILSALDRKDPGFLEDGRLAEVEAMQPDLTEASAAQADRIPSLNRWHPAAVMAWIAGTRVTSTKFQYQVLQPLATFALLVVLTAWGIFTLYSGPDQNTFGANLISDYFPLFLWGFGTDVLNKRLQDINFVR